MERRFLPVQMLHEGLDTALVFKNILLIGAFIRQHDPDTGIEKRQFP